MTALGTAKPVEDGKPRTRKSHTRSRTGCLTCRKRHRRCDEQRPICANCASADKPCEYRSALPLRERRKACIPGEQQPWAPPMNEPYAVISVPLPRAIGPCPSYPIDMPFKSGELFRYFYQLEDTASLVPMEKRQGVLNSAMKAPDALRNSMLVAGLYYAWNIGHLHNFEPSLLFHKLETMRLVNGWLRKPDPGAYWVCVRHIASLSLTECCLGNVAIAEAHLDGLVKFMDFQQPPIDLRLKSRVEDELSNRFILLTYSFVHGFKSRLRDIVDYDGRHQPGYTPTASEVEDYMHAWHKEEVHGLDIRLKALKLLPFFFSPLPLTTTFCDIDGAPIVDCLTSLTETFHFRRELSSQAYDKQLVWTEGAATRLLLIFVSSHVQSLSGHENAVAERTGAPRLMTSWSGMATAVALYLNSVLGLWNAGEPIQSRLHRRVLSILQRDLEQSSRQLDPGCRFSSDFWFWKAFVGAFSLTMASPAGDRNMLYDSESNFRRFILIWSKISGVRDWAVAKASLARIVWPQWSLGEGLAQALWERAVS